MSGFKEHFLEKYFAYRAKYVAHVGERAPHRRRLAAASEVARLVFVFLGSGFCALTFGLLTVAGFEQHSVWTPVFGVCAIAGGGGAVAALYGASRAACLLARSSGERGEPGKKNL